MKALCKVGLHKWSTYKEGGKDYYLSYRYCTRCGRVDFLELRIGSGRLHLANTEFSEVARVYRRFIEVHKEELGDALLCVANQLKEVGYVCQA